MLESLMKIDGIHLNFSDENKLWLNITIALIMFGVALELKLSDFKSLFLKPKPIVVGIISQFLLMPLLTFLVVILLKDSLTQTVALGMILVAACPGGNISNFMSWLAKGNVALSVSLTAFSSVFGILLTPLNFAFWGNLFIRFDEAGNAGLLCPLEVDPFNVLETMVIILGIPLVIGLLFSFKLPRVTARIIVPIKRFSILVFLAMVVIIFAKNYELFLFHIKFIFILVLIHNFLALSGGYYLAKLSGLSQTDRKTISIETGIQNSGLALALLFNPRVFPQDLALGGMVFIAAWWGVWHIVSGLTISGIWSGFSLKPQGNAGVLERP